MALHLVETQGIHASPKKRRLQFRQAKCLHQIDAAEPLQAATPVGSVPNRRYTKMYDVQEALV